MEATDKINNSADTNHNYYLSNSDLLLKTLPHGCKIERFYFGIEQKGTIFERTCLYIDHINNNVPIDVYRHRTLRIVVDYKQGYKGSIINSYSQNASPSFAR